MIKTRPLYRRITWLIGGLLILIMLGVTIVSSGNAAGSRYVDGGSFEVYLPMVFHSTPPALDYEARVVQLTNEERHANGCRPVTMDPRLRAAAEGHSEDMAINDYFSHTSKDGRSPWDRIHDEGYLFSVAGENIAAGYTSPESVLAGWMNSSGHRANILNCGFIHIGVGYYYLQPDTGSVNYQHYWTQIFASP